MKTTLFTTGLAACSFFCASLGLLAQPGLAGMDLLDEDLFPPEFFPNLSEVSQEELVLAGLQSLYPKRILSEPPEPDLPEPAEPVVREIGSDGVYIRVVHLPEALSVITANLNRPLVVLDLRFLSADLDSTLALGSLLTRQKELRLALAGDYPVPDEYRKGSAVTLRGEGLRAGNQTTFTLTNHETRGPIEALLAQLKADGEIISVGAPSPGETAAFRPFPGLESYYLISGEIRPSSGDSLLVSGFVPRVEVDVSHDEDAIGYGGLQEDVSLDDLVQARVSKQRYDEARLLRERGASPLPEDEPVEDERDLPQDIILQRALNIVKALQALGKIAG